MRTRIMGRRKENLIKVYSGITYDSFFEGYNPQNRQFDTSKLTKAQEKELYITLESYCGYSRKWAVRLSQEHKSPPVVFSGIIDKAQLRYYHKGLIWVIPSGKMNVDKLYQINSKDDNFLKIKPEDNSFKEDSDISNLLTSPSEPAE